MTKTAKLLALDTQDLTVISAMMQDAITRPQLFDYDPKAKRLTLVANRFAWDNDATNHSKKKPHERRQTLLSFAGVQNVRSRGINRDNTEQVLSILSIAFQPAAAPAGTVELVFANGPLVQLDVECIEVQMADLGGAWQTRFKPRHPLA